MNEWITNTFGPLLHAVFDPINSAFDGVYMPWARIAALALFIGTMIWVYTLKKEYVNLDAPKDFKWYHDLRLWTVVSMMPHVIVYLYF